MYLYTFFLIVQTVTKNDTVDVFKKVKGDVLFYYMSESLVFESYLKVFVFVLVYQNFSSSRDNTLSNQGDLSLIICKKESNYKNGLFNVYFFVFNFFVFF